MNKNAVLLELLREINQESEAKDVMRACKIAASTIEQLQAEVDRLKSEQQGEMFYALKDQYFEGQYFELGCVIDDFESDYGGGDILEVLCAEITTVKHPNKFITTLGHGKTQLFGTSEEAKQAIKAAQENDQ